MDYARKEATLSCKKEADTLANLSGSQSPMGFSSNNSQPTELSKLRHSKRYMKKIRFIHIQAGTSSTVIKIFS